jgi:hypothetical protein
MEGAKQRANLVGLPTPRIDSAIQEIQADPATFAQNLGDTILGFQEVGLLKAPQLPPVDENIRDIRKETRGRVSGQLKSVFNETNVIKTNFKKLENLGEQIRKGNRSAVPAALTAIVKLGDPSSIVSTEEAKNAINQKDAPAAFAALLQSKGTNSDVIDSIMRSFDLANPDTINVEELLSTGRALVSSAVPQIQNRFAVAQDLATNNLTPGGIKSIFTEKQTNSVASLSELLGEVQGQASAGQAPQDLSSLSDADLLRLAGGQ